MDIAQIRGMTEDHPSSEDDAPRQSSTTSTKAAAPKVPSISRSKIPGDPHDLLRGITEDHSSDEDWKPKKSPPATGRARQSSASKSKGPKGATGDPHRQLRAMADDLWSSEEETGKPAAGTEIRKPRGSSSGGKSGAKGSLDPHDLIRGLTEDHWSDDEEGGKASGKSGPRKLSSGAMSSSLKKPLSDTRPRLSSNSLRPDNTHDLIRGMTEDPWSSDEDKLSVRKSSTSSARAAAGGAQQTLVVGSPKKPSISLNKKTSPQIKPATLVGGQPRSPTSPGQPIRVLFVCLGNICRSPMAHGVLQYLTRPGYLPPGAPQVRVDSAGTGAYHALSPPDARTLELFKIHNIKGFVHKARRVRAVDFREVDYMLCMDAENLSDLRLRRKTLAEKAGADKEPKARIQLFGEYGGNQTEIVEDPYYGSNEGFDVAWEQVVRMARGFLREVVGVEVDTRDLMGMV